MYIFSLYGEAEIVATAYSNFGQRVKKVSNLIDFEEKPSLTTLCVPGGSEAEGEKC